MADATYHRPEHYAPAAKWLHWIVALCVLFMLAAGIAMTNVKEGPLQDRLYEFHESIGVVVLVLALARLAVRLACGAPAAYAGLTTFERIASTAVHHLLYLLIIAMPVLGLAMKSAYGAPVELFGLFTLPGFLPKSESTFKVLAAMHKAGGFFLLALIVLHVGGAFMHTFVKRDTVLWRMLPRSWG